MSLVDATIGGHQPLWSGSYRRALVEAPGRESPLREGAFLVARGRLSQEEATGSKLFVDEIVNLYPGAWRSALVISIEEHVDKWPATDTRAG
jgi:hypothetical protein